MQKFWPSMFFIASLQLKPPIQTKTLQIWRHKKFEKFPLPQFKISKEKLCWWVSIFPLIYWWLFKAKLNLVQSSYYWCVANEVKVSGTIMKTVCFSTVENTEPWIVHSMILLVVFFGPFLPLRLESFLIKMEVNYSQKLTSSCHRNVVSKVNPNIFSTMFMTRA